MDESQQRDRSRGDPTVWGDGPCETWSAASWLGVPLRQKASLVTELLSREQHQQVRVSTGLPQTAVEVALMVLSTAGAFFIAPPKHG